MLDLHTHSNVSDGSMSPAEVVHHAAELGLRTIALTDHDNMGGVEEAQAEGRKLGVEVIAGVELSLECPVPGGTMHMLGYFFDEGWRALQEPLLELQRSRYERNLLIVEKLTSLGLPMTYEEVAAKAGRRQIGRPHFAAVMVEKGYVSAYQEAFDQYLAKGAKAYLPKLQWKPEEGIERIHAAGGIAVQAHPVRLKCKSNEQLDELFRHLIGFGLDGIEVYHTEHDAEQTSFYRSLGEKHGLVMTGGSDFHGTYKPAVKMGVGKDNVRVPEECLASLKNFSAKSKPAVAAAD